MKSIETRNLEYKSEINTSFLKTVSAFANYGDGDIVFDVVDNGNIIGLRNLIKTTLSIENKINDSINPKPDYSIYIHENNSTMTLSVKEGFHKPYFYKHKAYKRENSSIVEVDRSELYKLILENSNKNFEDLRASTQNLSFRYLESSLKNEVGSTALNLDILKTLNLYSDKNGYNKSAELLSDENLYQMIDIVKFGDSVDVVLMREEVGKSSLIKAFNKTLTIFENNYIYELIEGKTRYKIEKIPKKAFKEALINSIIHRTWDINSSIKIYMFNDRIEITSPGGLPPEISREEYLKGKFSILKNPILESIFLKLKYIEEFGTDISRINESYKNSVMKPKYKIFKNSKTIILPVIKETMSF